MKENEDASMDPVLDERRRLEEFGAALDAFLITYFDRNLILFENRLRL